MADALERSVVTEEVCGQRECVVICVIYLMLFCRVQITIVNQSTKKKKFFFLFQGTVEKKHALREIPERRSVEAKREKIRIFLFNEIYQLPPINNIGANWLSDWLVNGQV